MKCGELQFEKISGGSWSPIFTMPRNEKKVYTALKMQHVPAYLPMRQHINLQPVKSKGKNYQYRRILQVPMFSNYLFAHITPEVRSDLMRNRSVIRILPTSECQEQTLLNELKIIQLVEKNSENIELDIFNGLQTGKKVKFIDGDFAGWDGTVLSLDDKDVTAFIAVTSINNSIKIKYPAAWCQVIEE